MAISTQAKNVTTETPAKVIAVSTPAYALNAAMGFCSLVSSNAMMETDVTAMAARPPACEKSSQNPTGHRGVLELRSRALRSAARPLSLVFA